MATVVPNEYDGRQAEQVEQVNADAQAGDVGYEHQIAVALRFVGMLLPLQDEPEHQRREERRECIDLAFDCREPERVAETVDKRPDKSRKESTRGEPHQMRDGPEK